jgi:hypothetical protein
MNLTAALVTASNLFEHEALSYQIVTLTQMNLKDVFCTSLG